MDILRRALIIAVVLTVASCSTEGSAATSSVSSASLADLGSKDSLPEQIIATQPPRPSSPLSEYRLSDEQREFVYETWQLGMQSCMAAQGYDFIPASYDDAKASDSVAMATDSAGVTLYGYGLPPGSDVLVRTPNDERAESEPAYRAALIGNEDDNSDGCRDVAYAHAFDESGLFSKLDHQVGQAGVDISVGVETTTEFQNLESSWSACMNAAGFQFRSPREPLSEYAGGGIDAGEVATRVADLNCQAAVEYEATIGELENAAELSWMEANQELLVQLSAAREQYLSDVETYKNSL